jgi:hypothetical protein
MISLLPCPECGVLAEVTDRFSLPGTTGPVEHLALQCMAGHHLRMPADLLPVPVQRPSPGPALLIAAWALRRGG